MHTIKVSPSEKVTALQANPYFDLLEVDTIRHLADSVTLRAYERGEVLFLEGETCAGLHILQKGCVKLYRLSPAGRQYIVRLCQEGDTFNEVSVFDNKSNPVNAEAIEPSRVWVVEPSSIQPMVTAHPDFTQKVIENLCGNLRMLVHAASEMAFYQVTHRLARLISQMPGDPPRGEEIIRLTQEQMAARLGTVREVVARSLRELERSGAIRTENRRITIADPVLLAHWTQGPWN